MMEIVPVGAMVVTVALRIGGSPRLSKREPGKFGKGPLSRASSREAVWPSSRINFMTSSARASACPEL